MTYNITYVSPKELFPTLFISKVYGLVNVFSHIVTCFAPLVAELSYPFPFLVYLATVGASFFAVQMLKELSDDEKEKDFTEIGIEKQEETNEPLVKGPVNLSV